MEVGVEHQHVPGSRPVRLARDLARYRCVLDEAHDDDVLIGLDVRPDTDRELGVPAEPVD
jgi:hypothetical protein